MPRRTGPCRQAERSTRREATRTLRRTRCTNLDRRGNVCNHRTVPITACSAAGERDKGPGACADDRTRAARADSTLGDRGLMFAFSTRRGGAQRRISPAARSALPRRVPRTCVARSRRSEWKCLLGRIWFLKISKGEFPLIDRESKPALCGRRTTVCRE